MMKVLVNRSFPFGKFRAINLFGLVIIKLREGESSNYLNLSDGFKRVCYHERIHGLQARFNKFKWLGFYINYIYQWIKLLIRLRSWNLAYRKNPYEVQAYSHQDDWWRSNYNSIVNKLWIINL